MKKVLLVLSFLLIILNSLRSEEKFRYDNTSWNVIREQFFDGTNSKVFRYEDDIHFALIDATKFDSIVVQEIVELLNPKCEIVSLKIDPVDANFIIQFDHKSNGTGHHVKQSHQDYKITSTKLTINADENEESIRKLAQYYILRNLTKIKYTSARTRYEGIFDSDSPKNTSLHEIDLDILKKIYSKNFYMDFKEGDVKLKGSLHYLQLRYKSSFVFLGLLILVILSVFLFTYLLTHSRSLLQGITIKSYLKDGVIMLFTIFILSSFFTFSMAQTINNSLLIAVILSKFATIFISGIVIIIVIFYLEKLFRTRARQIFQRLIITGLTTLLSIPITYLILLSVLNFIVPIHFKAENLAYLRSGGSNIVYISMAAALIRTLFIFLQHRAQSLINQKDVDLAKMTTLKNQAELSALHARINPHFLYNSLNSIAGLAESEPKKVQKMAMALSELFRYAVNKENDSMVSIHQEIEMVKKYLEVEQIRFGDHLVYSVNLEENLKDIQIPKFLIQPLVENAIKHGVSNMTENGIVKIDVQKTGKDLIISVFDNGKDFPNDLVSGYGLQNLYDKLEIIYKEDASITWKNGIDKHIQITLKNQF